MLERPPPEQAVTEPQPDPLDAVLAAAFGPVREPARPLGEFAANRTLGDFRILREIGRGGMGIVYEAEQISLGRRVALKVLPFAAALDPRQLQRFQNEAHAAAQLHHPSIVPVHGVGCERGIHYFVMQFIDGQSLAALLHQLQGAAADGPASAAFPPVSPTSPTLADLTTQPPSSTPAFFRVVTTLAIQAALALEYAHQRGVIHRDVKPGNLLLDAGGQLWITDFGLARLENASGQTMTGDLLGTLRYMSPEQADSRPGLVDHRTDIYALGATLYELLTLQPAFAAPERAALLRQIACDEPRPPRAVNPAIPPDLETIVMKAMAKSPAERYATAQELADDLRRFLEDRPIRARRPSLLQRLSKWSRRHEGLVRLAGFAAALGLAGLVAAAVLIWHAKEEAEQARRDALTANDLLRAEKQALQETLARERQTSYYQNIALAEVEWLAGKIDRAERFLEGCPRDLRQWEWHYLKRLLHPEMVRVRVAGLACVASSADGKRLATGNTRGDVELWDAATGDRLRGLPAAAGPIVGMAFRPDGQGLVTASQLPSQPTHPGPSGKLSAEVTAWDTSTGQSVFRFGHEGKVNGVSFSPRGDRFVVAANDRVLVCEGATGKELLAIAEEGRTAAFSSDGRTIVTSRMFAVAVWDAATGRRLHSLVQEPRTGGALLSAENVITAVTLGADAERIWTAGSDKNVLGWDLKSQQRVARLLAAGNRAAHSPVARTLATGTEGGTISLWDSGSEQLLARFPGHGGAVRTLLFSPDGKRLLSTGADETAKVWDVDQALRGPSQAQEGGILAFGPRGKTLVRVQGPGIGSLCDRTTGKRILALAGMVGRVAYADDESLLAFTGSRRDVGLVGPTTGRELSALGAKSDGFHTVAVSTGGRLVAASGKDLTIQVWEAATGRLAHRFPGNGARISRLAFHPDSQWLASASANGSVVLWDLASDTELRTLPEPNARALAIAVRPGGGQLAAALDNHTVRLWEPATGASLRLLRGHSGAVHDVVYSPDDKRLVSAGADRTIKLWDPDTGQEILTLRGHTALIHSLAFAPDGRQLASVTGGIIGIPIQGRLWDARPVAPE
jgi:WD40 repeat protein/serine/threonine protein kinase